MYANQVSELVVNVYSLLARPVFDPRYGKLQDERC